jgi:8-oxo-dGTP pyrophosphatase MutT (NUDIX family)
MNKQEKYRYTVGILFNQKLTRVLLILKSKPDWQKGKFNFPGGSFENGESAVECVAREFKEETDMNIPNWQHIGKIINPGNYFVDVLTSIHVSENNGLPKDMTEEHLEWHDIDDLPENIISNLSWLVPFARNVWKQGNADGLKFGTFEYSY